MAPDVRDVELEAARCARAGRAAARRARGASRSMRSRTPARETITWSGSTSDELHARAARRGPTKTAMSRAACRWRRSPRRRARRRRDHALQPQARANRRAGLSAGGAAPKRRAIAGEVDVGVASRRGRARQAAPRTPTSSTRAATRARATSATISARAERGRAARVGDPEKSPPCARCYRASAAARARGRCRGSATARARRDASCS